jgi:hypothetical protein
MASPLFCLQNADKFPCSADPIVLVSLGLGAGVCALLFVVFLLGQVSHHSRVHVHMYWKPEKQERFRV